MMFLGLNKAVIGDLSSNVSRWLFMGLAQEINVHKFGHPFVGDRSTRGGR